MRKAALAVFAALIVFASVASSRTHAPRPAEGVLISDVHFDPLADQSLLPQLIQADASQWDTIFQSSPQKKFAAYGADSNYTLMTSAFAQAGAKSSHGIVVFTGDLLRHDFADAFQAAGGSASQYQDFATKTAVFTVRKMQQAFKMPVIIALGNNDSTEGDYVLSPNCPFLTALGGEIAVVANAQDVQVRKDFAFGGYYAIPNPSVTSQEIVVLNTVFWSTNYTSPAALPAEPGATELRWLEERLGEAKAKAHSVSLVMHIPPGLDAYASLKKHTPQLLWKEQYENGFLALMARYRDTVTVSFAGHTHMDDFRVLSDAESKPFLPIRTTPAVSPMFHNNPAFSTFTYSQASGDVQDVTTFFLALTAEQPSWKQEYRFAKAYGVEAYNAASLSALVGRIRSKRKARDNYEKLYDVSSAPSPITAQPLTWPYYSCAQTTFTADAYAGCVAENSNAAAAPQTKR